VHGGEKDAQRGDSITSALGGSGREADEKGEESKSIDRGISPRMICEGLNKGKISKSSQEMGQRGD